MTADVVPPLLVLACWAVPASLPARGGTAPSAATRWAGRFATPLAALALAGVWCAAAPSGHFGAPLRLSGHAWALLPAGLLVGAGELACGALACGALGELAAARQGTGGQASQWSALQRSAWMRRTSALPGAGTLPPGVPLALGLLAAWAEQAAVFGIGVAGATRWAGAAAGWAFALVAAALRSCRPDARRSPRVAPVATLLTMVVETTLFQSVPLVLPLAGARWTFLLLARSRQEPSSTGRPADVTTTGGTR